ncbi:MAG: hypothetical protein PGN13_13350 [Patulibacter minatonensis]
MIVPSPLTLTNALPANVRPHLRVRVALLGHFVPYLRPSIVLTNNAGRRV